jgi:hypothetical protein
MPQDSFNIPQADFSFFITTLALQASIFLGSIPNPATNQKEENLEQAKFIIDTLGMLKDKTTGNLTSDEKNLLENVLSDLRMQYVTKSQITNHKPQTNHNSK